MKYKKVLQIDTLKSKPKFQKRQDLNFGGKSGELKQRVIHRKEFQKYKTCKTVS